MITSCPQKRPHSSFKITRGGPTDTTSYRDAYSHLQILKPTFQWLFLKKMTHSFLVLNSDILRQYKRGLLSFLAKLHHRTFPWTWSVLFRRLARVNVGQWPVPSPERHLSWNRPLLFYNFGLAVLLNLSQKASVRARDLWLLHDLRFRSFLPPTNH